MIKIRQCMFETNSSHVDAYTYRDLKGEVTYAKAKMDLTIENVSVPDDQFDSFKQSLKYIIREFMDIEKFEKDSNKIYLEGKKELFTYYMKFKLPTLTDVDGWDNPVEKHSVYEIENSLDHSKQLKLSDELLDSIRSKIDKSYCTNSILKVTLKYHVSGEYKFTDGYVESECIDSYGDPARRKGDYERYGIYDEERDFEINTKVIEKEIDINKSKTQQTVETAASLETQNTLTDSDFNLNYGESITCSYTLDNVKVTYTITKRTPTSRQKNIWERGGYMYYNINASIVNNNGLKTGYIAEIHRVPKYNKWKSGNIDEKINASIAKIFFRVVEEHFKNNLMVSEKM